MACISSPCSAFNYFEHRYLGNTAFSSALEYQRDPKFQELVKARTDELLSSGTSLSKRPDIVERVLEELPLQFGDLVGLAGDFTSDVEDLTDLIQRMKRRSEIRDQRARSLILATRRQWISACQWLYRSREAPIAHVLAGTIASTNWMTSNHSAPIPIRNSGSAGYRPSREELAEHEAVPNYISLASQNKDHFPRHSWKNYSNYHLKALQLAQCYRTPQNPCPHSKAGHDACSSERSCTRRSRSTFTGFVRVRAYRLEIRSLRCVGQVFVQSHQAATTANAQRTQRTWCRCDDFGTTCSDLG